MMAIEARTEMRPLQISNLERRSRRRPSTRAKRCHSGLSHAQILLASHDRLVMLYGHPAVTQLTLCTAAERALSGEPVVYLDAAHTYDALMIGRFAKARRQQPRKVLGMIHVARAFSWHQMERLLSHCLSGALDRYEARTAIISGLFESLSEEQASDREIARMTDRVVESVRELTLKGCLLLCPCPSIPMETAIGRRLFTGLQGLADRSVLVKEVQGEVSLEEERPATTVEQGGHS